MKPLQDIPDGGDSRPAWTASFFGELVVELEGKYLEVINYHQKLTEAPYPIDVMIATRQDLARRMRVIEEKEALRDSYEKVHSYATTVINDLLRKEKRIRTLFRAVQVYCLMRERHINRIAPLIAQYRAYYRLQKKIDRAIDRNAKGQNVTKVFAMEVRKRETKTPYIKVYCPGLEEFTELATTLTALETVRVANVASDRSYNQSLTVYPAKGCSIVDTEVAVKRAMEVYFTHRRENQGPDAQPER